MECEHNPDKATLLHLILQLADILTCIYQVMQSAQFDVLLCEQHCHQHHHIQPPVTLFSSCRSALFPTVLIVPLPLN